MKFLGTGGGEGIPNPFCTCRICENARKKGGREIRTRSSLMLDDKVIIDMGADYFAQGFLHGVRFDGLEHVLYTHVHSDHFDSSILWERRMNRRTDYTPLNMYFAPGGKDIIDRVYYAEPFREANMNLSGPDRANFVTLEFYREAKIGDYRITPLKGTHSTEFEENAANYLIENDKMKMYYAVDTGDFHEDTLKHLENAALDLLIIECTFPSIDREYLPNLKGHLDVLHLLKNLDLLYKNGAITEKTRIYVTHISAVCSTHSELCEYFDSLSLPYKINVAYDGLEI